jgi:hypothetical protein
MSVCSLWVLNMFKIDTQGKPKSNPHPARHLMECAAGCWCTDSLTFDTMEDARFLPCGHSFGAASISEWLKTKPECPFCGACVPAGDLLPNYSLRDALLHHRNVLAAAALAAETLVGFSGDCDCCCALGAAAPKGPWRVCAAWATG